MGIELKSVITTMLEVQEEAEKPEHAEWQVIQVNYAQVFDNEADPNAVVIFFGKKAVPVEPAFVPAPLTAEEEAAAQSLLSQEEANKKK